MEPLVERHYTEAGDNPLTETKTTKMLAELRNSNGEIIFQRDVIAPTHWSQQAVNIVAEKYLAPGEEILDMIDRVASTITEWGEDQGYFDDQEGLQKYPPERRIDEEASEAFYAELCYILINQMAAFNSPVWFNMGLEEQPQVSACFIQSLDDSLESILDLCKKEGMLFKNGSGTGTNFSNLRGEGEPLNKGRGRSSGAVSFMKGSDTFAGSIKSGGKTRRAAKMAILDVDHPDIETFIDCKAIEEDKAQALINAGYGREFNQAGGAYDSIAFQNANHSVRATDKFMKAATSTKNTSFQLIGRVSPEANRTVDAKDLLYKIAKAAHRCGDPGLQFHDTINRMHTCPKEGPIRASNPCSEYMHIDDSACNLASIKLTEFFREGTFDIEGFTHTINVMILAMDIIIDKASYPSEKIGENAKRFRQLGLGYADLGGLLMLMGLPYGSRDGRFVAGSITSALAAQSYDMSMRIAAVMGPYDSGKHLEDHKKVLLKHRDHHIEYDRLRGLRIGSKSSNLALQSIEELRSKARMTWEGLLPDNFAVNLRNSQVTVVAPTGTIAFLMDCATTGIEPDTALIKTKRMIGGAVIRIVNPLIPKALANLGFEDTAIVEICKYIETHETVEGHPYIQDEYLPIFDCALPSVGTDRCIAPEDHLLMMAAVQPYLSGAISKTVNVPESTTIEEIRDLYIRSWNLGLKAVAIYRDGCKSSQPLSTGHKGRDNIGGLELQPILEDDLGPCALPGRKRLPTTRKSLTHKFSIGGHEGYLIVGLYEDGKPGEVFIKMAKEGSTVSGMMDGFATTFSIALQHGVPLETLLDKMKGTRFPPEGFTGEEEKRITTSPLDYIAWYLNSIWGGTNKEKDQVSTNEAKVPNSRSPSSKGITLDSPLCLGCGCSMERSGSCFRCPNCGSTSGCS